MNNYLSYLLFGIFLYLASYIFYVKISRGLGHKAEYLQLRRFLPCAILAVLPCYLAQIPLTSPQFITSFRDFMDYYLPSFLLYYLS